MLYQAIHYKILSFLSFLMILASSSHAQVEKFTGRAVNAKGDLEYIEEHSVQLKNNQIASLRTKYFDSEYKKIGEITSDFSAGSRFGSYDFKDERLEYKDGAKVFSDKIMLYSQDTPRGNVKKKYFDRDSDQILGQGFHPFIQENFEALLRGEVYEAKLVLPAQMNQFKVRISPTKEVDGRLKIRIELDNWFLRLFAPSIVAEYEISTRRLVSYRGVSAISNASGQNVQVTITYSYPQKNYSEISQ